MINLQLVERQRARLYKNQLRRQFQEKQQMKKNHSLQLKSKQQHEIQQKMQLANEHLKSQKQRHSSIINQLRQENMELANMKNHNKKLEESFVQQFPLKGNNIMEALYHHNDIRGKNYKNVAKKLVQTYLQQQNLQKQQSKQIKHQEINQDMKHLETLKQLENLRKQKYEQYKNKYSPEPKGGQIHKKLQQVNEQYRRSLENFAYKGKDILDSLKRDDSQQIYQRNKRVQSELRNQIQQKKTKQSIEKQQHSSQEPNLQKSILGSLLFKDSHFDKGQYADYLRKQMDEKDFRKSTEKVELKQKVEIGSIFGGQGGPQRLKMIKYIDKNLGIQSEYLKNIQNVNKSIGSPYRIKNLYEFNGQTQRTKMNESLRYEKYENHQNPQKSNTEQHSKGQNNERKIQSSNNQQTIRLSSSKNGHTPRSYLGYDLIKGSSKRYEY